MLQRLEVKNFRSLLNLVLDIPSPYFCIVGENDAGKSNIVTALKWLLDPNYMSKKMPSVDLSRTTPSLEVMMTADVSLTGLRLAIPRKQKERLAGAGSNLQVRRRFVFAQPVQSPLTSLMHTDYASASKREIWEGGSAGHGPWSAEGSLDRYLPRLIHIRPSDIGRFGSSSAFVAPASSEEKLQQLLWPDELIDQDRQWVVEQLTGVLKPLIPFYFDVDLRIHDETRKIIYFDEYGYHVPLYKAGSGITQIIYTLSRIALARRQFYRGQPGRLLLFIDEPEQHLSSGMQKSYADHLVQLSHAHQIMVTSHSSMFVRRDIKGANCILVRGSANGTEARQGVSAEIAAIRATLGITGEDSLYFGEVNVLVEGPTEVSALQQIFARLHKDNLVSFKPSQLTLISCEGIDKIIQFAKLFTRIGLGVVILVDNENRTKNIEREVKKDDQLDATVILLKIPLTGSLREAEFEDLFSRSTLLAAVNEHIIQRHGWNLNTTDLDNFYTAQAYNEYKKWGDTLAAMLMARSYISHKDQMDEMVSKPGIIDIVVANTTTRDIPEFFKNDLAQAITTMIALRPRASIPGVSMGIVPPARNTSWLHEANLTATLDHDE